MQFVAAYGCFGLAALFLLWGTFSLIRIWYWKHKVRPYKRHLFLKAEWQKKIRIAVGIPCTAGVILALVGGGMLIVWRDYL